MPSNPNGSCPLGRENKTNIESMGREVHEAKGRLYDVENDIQGLAIRMERTTVKLGIIVAVIVGLLTTAGQIVIANMLR